MDDCRDNIHGVAQFVADTNLVMALWRHYDNSNNDMCIRTRVCMCVHASLLYETSVRPIRFTFVHICIL